MFQRLLKQIKPVILISMILLVSGCRKKMFSQDIQDCDHMANYYEDGEHYVRRDMITDEGVMDRKKMFFEYKEKNSECYPTKTFKSNP